MSKQIISLGAQATSQLQVVYTVLFWFPITSGQRPQTAGSAWPGASAAENTAIQNGSVFELQTTFVFPINTPIATIKICLQQEWTNRNQQLNGVGPNSTAGVFYDSSTGWSA